MKIENSIFCALYERVISNPDKIAVCDEIKSLTNQELYEHILKCRTALWEKSYYKNDIIILNMENSVDWVVHFFSFLSIGCIVAPVSSKMTENEISKLLDKLDSQYERYYLLEEAVDYERIEIVNKLDDLPDNDMTAILHMTSGSTGVPKLCVRSHKNLFAEGMSYVRTLHLTSEDTIVTPLQVYHSYALGYACMGSVASGCTLVLISNHSPRKLLKCIEKHHATIALVVPSILKELENLYLDRDYDTSSLRCFMSGAGPLNEESVKKVEEKYNVAVYSNYGSTETGALATGMDNRLPNSVGGCMYGVEIIIKDVHGKRLGVGERGYIYVKSDAVMSGYYADLTQVFDENGFFYMGDIGYLDENKNLFIVGRTKFFINVGGKKVNPKEVEEVILAIDGVKEVFVHPGHRSDEKEIVVAELVTSKDITKEFVTNYCKTYLSDYKIPGSILFKESIKKNELGKYSVDGE